MFGEDPHGINQKWTEEGFRLITEAKDRHYHGNNRVTDLDGAHEVIKMICYALIYEGVDLEKLTNDAIEAARDDYASIHAHMNLRDNDAR